MFWTIPGHMDRKRISRRFRISNLRQRGRSFVRDMAAQIFVNPALCHISPFRRPIGPIIGPRTIYTSNWYRPSTQMLLLWQFFQSYWRPKMMGWQNEGQNGNKQSFKTKAHGGASSKHWFRHVKENVSLWSKMSIGQAPVENKETQSKTFLLAFPLVKKKSSSFCFFTS